MAADIICSEPARLQPQLRLKIIWKKRLAGTVRYFGCPAEENGSGKAYMARAGFFDDVDVVFFVAPQNHSRVNECHVTS